MSALGNLLEWYNFIFALPLLVGLLLSVGVVFTGIGHSADAGSGGDGSHDAHHAGEHVGHDAHDHNPPSLLGTLGGWFGFGKGASLTLLVPVLMATWGLVGLLSNSAFSAALPPSLFFVVSVALGVAAAGLVGNTVSGLVGRVFSTAKPNTRDRDLVGRGGRAAFRIDAQGGAANVRDKAGNVYRVVCKTLPGEPALEAGSEILVVDHDPAKGVYFVQAHPFPEQAPVR